MPSEEADDDLEISRTRPAPCPSLRGVGEFQTDSGQCIQEATTKYEVSERIYRRCMRAQGWERVQTHYPSDRQFRGPEDEDEFLSPPIPSASGDQAQRAARTTRPAGARRHRGRSIARGDDISARVGACGPDLTTPFN